MMSVEKGGGRGGGVLAAGGGGGIDPSNLHLKKELTQIRKAAARGLRDPGTSSSWRSPLNSARSLTKHHYVHHQKNNDGNPISCSSIQQFLEMPLQIQSNANNYNNTTSGNNKGNVKEKEKRVFLYNWRSQKSESERSKQIDADNNSKDDDVSFSSVDEGSMSDARNGGGNDAYSGIFKCKDTDFTPSIRRTVKKKSKRSNNSNYSLRHHNEKLQKQIILSRCAKNILGREDLSSLVDQSDDTEDYCNSEDFRRASTISPLLARIKNKAWAGKNHRKEDDSISYLSTSSYNKYGIKNPSTVGSWDATTTSFNDADDEVDDDHLDFAGQKGCGIPCYWSKRSSPSLSDTLRRKGSTFFCGTHQRRLNHRGSSLASKKRMSSRVPLLMSNGRSGSSDDEISTNLGELDLEALSRLDGRRWSSSCRSQDGLELVALNGEEANEEEGFSPENIRSLSYKYRPMFFEELIGQNIVTQSLVNGLSRKRVAPVYLFHGPRGTGKTSTARIFSAALNCLAAEESSKPCGVCRECANFISGKNNNYNLREVDGSSKKGSDKFRNLLKTLLSVNPSAFSQFKVFVVDECHLLPSKTWLMFLRLLEKPLPRVVFVLVTSDVENVPRTVLSRCQKHVFNKISSVEIVGRLRKIASDENLDVEMDALEMIASNADGSLRDAETMIDQLSLFGKRITVSLVNELIGVVSDEKLLDLLELAMSSNATETVIRARELMDSGIDPIVLMSQMATLIVDIIAGTHPSVDSKHGSFFGGRSLLERELDRLKHALTLLSEAEKHLRVSSERSTWFTATLLQLGSMPSPDRTHSGSSRRHSSKTTEEDNLILLREANVHKQRADSQLLPEKLASPIEPFARSNHHDSTSKDNNPKQSQALIDGGRTALRCTNLKMLNNIWIQCIQKCHSKTLRQLLHSHGRLLSISEVKGGCVAHIGFGDRNIKTRAEGFLSSITDSFEIILQRNVEVKIILLPDKTQMELFDSIAGNNNTNASKKIKSEIPVKRIESIIHEQRLETEWLQAMEKNTVASMRPERNQVLPQEGNYTPHELESMNSVDAPYDELNHEIKALKIDGVMRVNQKEQIAKRVENYPISPSLLHNSSFASNFSKDNVGYESGSGAAGCSGLFCWNNTRPHRRGKAKQGTPLRGRRFSWFGECAKSRRRDNRLNR